MYILTLKLLLMLYKSNYTHCVPFDFFNTESILFL